MFFVKMFPELMISLETLPTLSTLLHLVLLVLHLVVFLQVVGQVILVGTLLQEPNVTQFTIIFVFIFFTCILGISKLWLRLSFRFWLIIFCCIKRLHVNIILASLYDQLLLHCDAEVAGRITGH